MEEYVRWRQNTVANYIATGSLRRAPGSRVRMRWWEQEVIDLDRERESAAAVVEEEGLEE